MAISPTSISGLLNLVGPPGSPGMTVVADQNLTGGVTTGTPINEPDLYLPGGSHGAENDVLVDGAQQVVPFYDGTNYFQTSLPAKQPPSFTTAPASLDLNATPPDNFLQWNSAYQAEYLKNNGGAAHGEVTIGLPGNQIHVVLASTNDRVYILENLQKTDFSKMPAADQMNIAKTSFFQTTLGPTLNLTTYTDPTTNPALGTINQFLSALGMTVPSPPNISFYSDPSAPPSAAGTTDPTNSAISFAAMPAADRQIFIDELKLLGKQISGMSVFSQTDLANATTAITGRLELAARFARFSPGATPAPGTPPTTSVDCTLKYGQTSSPPSSTDGPTLVSTDGNTTVANGYKNLITQEASIRNLAVADDQLVQTALSDPTLDAPTLIFKFQLDANLAQEAEVNASTEEVKQLNALLNLYSQMQNIVNQTLQQFGDDPKQKLGLLGKSSWSDVPTSPSPSDQVIVAIFEDYMGVDSKHPLEIAYNIQKPTLDMVYNIKDSNHDSGYLNPYLKDSWNAFNSSLSDTVSQLNQQSQLKMNDINSATKQKDRHFDLANSALSKMSDMIQTIGRGLA